MKLRSSARRAGRHVADLIHSIPGGRRRHEPLTDRGGATGTPSHDADEAPPSLDQEENWAVSGGGVAGSRGESSRKARRSR